MRAMVIGISVVALLGTAAAAQVLRPGVILRATPPAAQNSDPMLETAPPWLAEVNALKKQVDQLGQRVNSLEGQVQQSNQALAALRTEHENHTHSQTQPALVWANARCENYDDDPDWIGCPRITKWSPADRRVATGRPIQAEPGTTLP